jgi:hypothetical protein
MAEVQKDTQTGELAQRFIEFVMMQAQNAALFLGQIPNPQTGRPEINLELARMFIDQLAMIQEKTRGNLTNEEAAVLRNAISNLQMAFVEVSQAQKSGGVAATTGPTPEPEPSPESSSAKESAPAAEAPPSVSSEERESKKKFSKSYGS